MMNKIQVERTDRCVVKNRSLYPEVVNVMSRALEQFASKAHGYKNYSSQPVYTYPVLLVENLEKKDYKKFVCYFNSQRIGLLLNRSNIGMRHNPIINSSNLETQSVLRDLLNENENAFSVIFHDLAMREKVEQWLEKHCPYVVVYLDDLFIEQKPKMEFIANSVRRSKVRQSMQNVRFP